MVDCIFGGEHYVRTGNIVLCVVFEAALWGTVYWQEETSFCALCSKLLCKSAVTKATKLQCKAADGRLGGLNWH